MKQKFVLSLSILIVVTHSLRADLLDGLVAYFPLNGGGHSTVVEQVNGSTATFYGTYASTGLNWITAAPGVYLYDGEAMRLQSDSNAVGAGITDEFTLSAWISPDQSLTNRAIVTKGVTQAAYSLMLLSNGALSFAVNTNGLSGGSPEANWQSSSVISTLDPTVWYHVGVTYDGTTLRFYINGVQDSNEYTVPIAVGTVDEPLVLGADLPGVDDYYTGGLRSIAIYDRALQNSEIADLHSGSEPALAMLATDYTGLWIGQAQLNEVKELSSGTWASAPSSFTEKVILHVNRAGVVRLLSQATIMQTRVEAPATPEQVILSRTDLIPNYDGITPRGGDFVGQRFSSATIPMAGDSALLVQTGETLSADLSLAPADPLNPFRHKYHPDLKNGYDIGRTLSFTVPTGDSPLDNEFTGMFSETITGLHKDSLEARGSVTFIRVSTSGQLND